MLSRKRRRKGVMKILVANLGSTSFKYRLFDMADERVLARGGVERIGRKITLLSPGRSGKRREPGGGVGSRRSCQALSETTLRSQTELLEGFIRVGGHRVQSG